jgi:uncharacterized protein YcbK (DUF882 family)
MISKHITINEATYSAKAIANKISNVPNESQLEAMQLVAEKLFEPLRVWYGKPIKINSFFRNLEVNKLVGGSSSTSQHCKGEAIDISAGSKTENKKLFDYVCKNLDFDQCINEYDFTWVHISYKSKGNRKQILVIK